ncbi:MAG: type II toxin-antitoxin system VapC family toxin [Propionibacteriaceae bacterium]|jgi:tRNA(fMet)-specific endonuclease VapC|nr:type II toxin-antitoxin system VapC family toxin [Propionibacteriaceae bacterium]
MNRYMLDTNICSFLIRGKNPRLEARLASEVKQGCFLMISAITYMELVYGATSPKSSPKWLPLVNALVDRLDTVCGWGRDTIDEAVRLRSRLAAAGTPIGDNDTAIAAQALDERCILVTNNVKHFKRVEGLQVQDWTEGYRCR